MKNKLFSNKKKLLFASIIVAMAIVVLLLAILINNNPNTNNVVESKTERMQIIVNIGDYDGGACSFYVFNDNGKSTSRCVRFNRDDALKLAGYDDYTDVLNNTEYDYMKLDVDVTKKTERLTPSTPEPDYKNYEVYTVVKIYSSEAISIDD